MIACVFTCAWLTLPWFRKDIFLQHLQIDQTLSVSCVPSLAWHLLCIQFRQSSFSVCSPAVLHPNSSSGGPSVYLPSSARTLRILEEATALLRTRHALHGVAAYTVLVAVYRLALHLVNVPKSGIWMLANLLYRVRWVPFVRSDHLEQCCGRDVLMKDIDCKAPCGALVVKAQWICKNPSNWKLAQINPDWSTFAAISFRLCYVAGVHLTRGFFCLGGRFTLLALFWC